MLVDKVCGALMDTGKVSLIGAWNDSPCRTKEEVVQLLNRTALALDRRGQ